MRLFRCATAEGSTWWADGRISVDDFAGILTDPPKLGVPEARNGANRLAAPIPADVDVWAAGVTYRRSREARVEESSARDVYDLVYEAERPELFYKAHGSDVVGPLEPVNIRPDSGWDVPEPEIVLVVNAHGGVAGWTIGNDLSSRSIEGENPLYLPQAKIYQGSCALGPWIELSTAGRIPIVELRLTVRRSHEVVFEESLSTAAMHRSFDELLDFLWRSVGAYGRPVYLLTGTGIVPPSDFSLQANDEIEVAVGAMRLVNPVSELSQPPRCTLPEPGVTRPGTGAEDS